MADLVFPNKEKIGAFIGFVESAEASFLADYLPDCNDHWYNTVCGTLEQVQMPYFNGQIVNTAAYIFYKLCKNHGLPDGNKRTAVIIMYLFLYENDYIPHIDTDALVRLAHSVAISSREDHEAYIEHLKFTFSWVIDVADSDDK